MGAARWRCDKETGHGPVDFTHALGASCDVFYYQAGAQLGADLIAKWARRLGLGAPTGFDVTTEVPGVIPDVAWHDDHLDGGYQRGMAVNLAIGQGDVNVTPMQQLVFYGALANGILWRPQVVLRIEDSAGQVLQQFAPQERGRVELKPSTRETVLKGLVAAVNEPYGTGYRLKTDAYAIAGKTGTAQVVKLGAARLRADQVGYFQRDHAWFAAFAPADDPQIVVVVLNEHSGFGAANAAPTAGAVIKAFFETRAQDEVERSGSSLRPAAPKAAPPRPPASPDRPPERAGHPVLGAGRPGPAEAGGGHGG
jgi:penicillin-binding protein 2